MSRRTTRLIAAVLTAATVIGAAGAARPAPGPSNDAWLGELALKRLDDAVKTGKYATLAADVEKLIQARATCVEINDLATINDLVYVHRAAKVLPEAAKVGKAEFAAYLASHREVLRLLLRAMGDTPSPAKAVTQLHDLYTLDAKRVSNYPDLAVAFATSGDRYARYTPAGARMSLRQSFAYYTSKRRFVYNMQRLPYELSRYLADTRLSLNERLWAWDQYGSSDSPVRCYFHVKYDTDYSQKGKAKKISGHPYTLWNLRQYGGVCVDQAYFAAHVCKSLGIPATVVAGRSSGGVGHAWVARLVLTNSGRSAEWDSTTARYRSHLYYTGKTTSPATGADLSDAELVLAGYAAMQPLQDREYADAALYVARHIHDNRKADWGDAVALVKSAAADFTKRAYKGAKPPNLSWARLTIKSKAQLAEEFLAAALKRNLALNDGWKFLVELRKADAIELGHLDSFLDILIERTAKAFPEYSCRIVLDVATTVPAGAARLKTYQNCLRCFGKRPDLAGEILIAMGNEYAALRHGDLAVKTYMQAADKAIKVPEVVLAATDQACKVLLAMGKAPQAESMYKGLISRVKPDGDPMFFTQTVYYQLNVRLAELYRKMGKHSNAARIMSRLKQ